MAARRGSLLRILPLLACLRGGGAKREDLQEVIAQEHRPSRSPTGTRDNRPNPGQHVNRSNGLNPKLEMMVHGRNLGGGGHRFQNKHPSQFKNGQKILAPKSHGRIMSQQPGQITEPGSPGISEHSEGQHALGEGSDGDGYSAEVEDDAPTFVHQDLGDMQIGRPNRDKLQQKQRLHHAQNQLQGLHHAQNQLQGSNTFQRYQGLNRALKEQNQGLYSNGRFGDLVDFNDKEVQDLLHGPGAGALKGHNHAHDQQLQRQLDLNGEIDFGSEEEDTIFNEQGLGRGNEVRATRMAKPDVVDASLRTTKKCPERDDSTTCSQGLEWHVFVESAGLGGIGGSHSEVLICKMDSFTRSVLKLPDAVPAGYGELLERQIWANQGSTNCYSIAYGADGVGLHRKKLSEESMYAAKVDCSTTTKYFKGCVKTYRTLENPETPTLENPATPESTTPVDVWRHVSYWTDKDTWAEYQWMFDMVNNNLRSYQSWEGEDYNGITLGSQHNCNTFSATLLGCVLKLDYDIYLPSQAGLSNFGTVTCAWTKTEVKEVKKSGSGGRPRPGQVHPCDGSTGALGSVSNSVSHSVSKSSQNN